MRCFCPRNIPPDVWWSFRSWYFILLNITLNEWLFRALSYSSCTICLRVLKLLQGSLFIPVAYIKKLRVKGMKWLAWDYAPSKQKSWDLELSPCNSEPSVPCTWRQSWLRTRDCVSTALHCACNILRSPLLWVVSRQALLVSPLYWISLISYTQHVTVCTVIFPGMCATCTPEGPSIYLFFKNLPNFKAPFLSTYRITAVVSSR